MTLHSIAVLGIVAGNVAVARSFLRGGRVSRWIERRIDRRGSSAAVTAEDPFRRSDATFAWFPVPRAIATLLGAATLLWIGDTLCSEDESRRLLALVVALLFGVAPVLAFLRACALHFRANASRGEKYEWIAVSLGMNALGLAVVNSTGGYGFMWRFHGEAVAAPMVALVVASCFSRPLVAVAEPLGRRATAAAALVAAPALGLILHRATWFFALVSVVTAAATLACRPTAPLLRDKSKYIPACIAVASGLLLVPTLTLQALTLSGLRERLLPHDGVVLTVGRVLAGIFFVVILLGVSAAEVGASGETRAWQRRTFAVVRRFTIASLVLSALIDVQFVTLWLLLLRFRLGEQIRSRPVVFLRSFGDEGVAVAFGGIVAPVARPLATVIGIAHERQRPAVVHALTQALDRAELSIVADEVWRDWVRRAIANAAAVVIDYSSRTSGVEWELREATAIAGRGRVVVLYDEQRATPPAGTHSISYRTEPAALRDARVAFKRWLLEQLADDSERR